METLLPSEIARLVLGYLEETECLEVAKLFLETSSYLQECRSVVSHGKKFSTKVNGLSLICILEKFWSINSIIQDKLSKLEEYYELKNCKDLTEQLKLLIDVSRGQRFFVNINVPSQASQSSDVLLRVANSTNRDRWSESDEQNKIKRSLKNDTSNNEQLKLDNKQCCGTVEYSSINEAIELSHDKPVEYLCAAPNGKCLVSSFNLNKSFESISEQQKMNSTATDTLELMQYATAEVQTASEDVESESDSTDTPVENLSLLTKELLNRTELHKRIAEKINQVLPTDSMMKDSCVTEIALGELNTSIMTELNSAIKSIVTATETDPVFEKFLHEIIGSNDDTEISSNKNNLQDSVKTDRVNDNTLNCDLVNNFQAQTEFLSGRITEASLNRSNESQPLMEISPINKNNINLKNKEIPLDDYNAAAIQSIIDVNNLSLEQRDISDKNIESVKNSPIEKPEIIFTENNSSLRTTAQIQNKKLPKKLIRKSKDQKKLITSNNSEVVIPTLIVCPKEEVVKYLEPASSICHSAKSQFIPIAPKLPQMISETVYLRTVNVPQKNLYDEVKVVQPAIKPNFIAKTSCKQSYSTLDSDVNFRQSESITLYGSKAQNSIVTKSFDMPTVNLEDSVILSETELSPYLKLNQPIKDQNFTLDKKENRPCTSLQSIDNKNCTTLIKRTPKSLLKDRSKNCRLSLSTPRRTKNHVRALNFNTPTENLNNYKYNTNISTQSLLPINISKRLCRANLFMSSSMIQGVTKSTKFSKHLKTPDKAQKLLSTSITSNSPVPTLKGGWNKISGVESVIIHGSQSDGDSPPKKKRATEKTVQQSTLDKTWDADLRNSVNISEKLLRGNKIYNHEIKDETGAVTKPKSSGVIELKIGDIDDSCNKNEKEQKNFYAEQNNFKNNCNNSVILQKTQEQNLKKVSTMKGVVKKYAKLKTIATKISDNGKKKYISDIESNNKLNDITEIVHKHSSNKLNLETPRKTITYEIPPTPRVLSPTNTSVSITQIVNEDSARVQSFLSTPDFPPTPNINLTPQEISVNTIDSIKKNFSQSYYQPSFESAPQIDKNQYETKSVVKSLKLMKECSNEKVEITQFEVIKENLPKESASQELKLSTLTKGEEHNEIMNNASENDSSSSSLCSNSSFTSISCYSCNISNTSSKVIVNNQIDNTPKKSEELFNNCVSTAINNSSSTIGEFPNANKNKEIINIIENNEKLITVNTDLSIAQTVDKKKVSDTFRDTNIETPEKNKVLLTEENKLETLIPSKSAVETLTNLSTKISALITTESLKESNDSQCEKNYTLLQANNDCYNKQSNLSLNIGLDQIRSQLNEKRLRIMKKLNSKVKINMNSFKQVNSKQKNRNSKKYESLIKQKINEGYKKQNDDYQIKVYDHSGEVLNKNNETDNFTSKKPRKNNIHDKCNLQEKKDRTRYENVATNQTLRKKSTQLAFKNKKNEEKRVKSSSMSSTADNPYIVEDNKNEKLQNNCNVKTIENCKKSKVDMIKRDLFSDEENNGTTLNLNQFNISPNNINQVQQINSLHIRSLTEFLDSPKEKLVVLESLKLVPSNKYSMAAEVKSNNAILFRNHLEVRLIYDETDKKKRRKPNIADSNFKIQTGNEDNSWIQITTTPFKEIFTIIPSKPKLRKINTNKKSVPNSKSFNVCDGPKQKKLKCNEIIIMPMNLHPLATSSPIGNVSVPKIMFKNELGSNKCSLASNKKKNDEHCKIVYNRTEHFGHGDKTINKDSIAASDPKILLKQVDINKFLTKVHGPET